jgi:zona occludens toxin
MSISLYTGHVGSGKTYEVVKSVILPALASGRTVVANIEGLNREAIMEWVEKMPGCRPGGELVVVERLDVRSPFFFPVRQDDGSYQPSQWVPLGALVCVDECPFYWGASESIPAQHLAFFREHRHICAADGTACDLTIISQTVDAVHKSLRGLVEYSIDCGRLSALGMNSKYTTISYEGARRSGKYVMGRATHTYDKRIFPLYKSFAHESGKIVQTDKRFTIWASKFFWLAVILAPFVFVASLWFLYHQFFPGRGMAFAAPVPGAVSQPLAGSSASPGAAPGAVPASAVPAVRRDSGEPSTWHVVGSAVVRGQSWAVLRRPGYPLRYLPAGACSMSMGQILFCRVDGDVYTPDSAVSASGSGLPLDTLKGGK